MTNDQLKVIAGALMGAVWVGFTIHPVPGCGEIIDYCKNGLIALGAYHFGSTRGTPAAPTFPAST
jgi:hypothetical protein